MNRLPRFVRIVVPLMLLGGSAYLGANSANATEDPKITAAGTAVEDYIASLGSLALLPSLTQQLPLTTLDPKGPAGLALSASLTAASTGLDSSYDGVTSLVSAIEARDGTSGGVHYALGVGCDGGIGCDAPVTGNLLTSSTLDLVVPVHLSRNVNASLSFDGGPVKVRDGSIAAVLHFDTTLHLIVDLDHVIADPATSIALVSPTAANMTATVTSAAVSVDTNLGLTTLHVAGNV